MGTMLSIITVCYQAKDKLVKTAENLMEQTYSDFEYLVIDGGSTDGTRLVLTQLEHRFFDMVIPFHYVSEKDNGIYDAMNKGARMAHGKYLLFLNAGDTLSDPQVLQRIFAAKPFAQVIYGDTICIYKDRQKLYPALPLDHLCYEMAFCHQSALIDRELMLKYPYDTSYKICADHHFFLQTYLRGASYQYMSGSIAIYEIEGFSDKNKMLSHKEQHRMQKELGIYKVTPSYIRREIKFYLKQLVKLVFGNTLIDFIRQKKLS